MSSTAKSTPTPTTPPHHRTLATILKSPPTPSTLRARALLFPFTSRN